MRILYLENAKFDLFHPYLEVLEKQNCIKANISKEAEKGRENRF